MLTSVPASAQAGARHRAASLQAQRKRLIPDPLDLPPQLPQLALEALHASAKSNTESPVPKIDMGGHPTEETPEQEPPLRHGAKENDAEQPNALRNKATPKRRSLLVQFPLLLSPRSKAISDAMGEEQSIASPDTVAMRVARARRRSSALSSQVARAPAL